MGMGGGIGIVSFFRWRRESTDENLDETGMAELYPTPVNILHPDSLFFFHLPYFANRRCHS